MDYQAALDDLQTRTVSLLSATGEFAGAFKRLDASAYQPGALSSKHKELIGLLMGVAMRCEDCITFHAKRCARAGVSREELAEGLAVCAQMGGGPAVAFGSKALAAFDAFSKR